MIDTSKIIHVQNSIKIIIITILLVMMSVAIYFTFTYAQSESDADWVILSFSFAQLAATGLILFILLIFSERHSNEKILKEKSDDFTEVLFPRALQANGVKVNIAKRDGPLMRYYKIEQNDVSMTIGFLFNLKRFALNLYLSKSTDQFKTLDDIQDYFAHGFDIAESIGYNCSLAENDDPYLQQRCYTLTFMQENLSDDFLGKPIDKLFFAQGHGTNDFMVPIATTIR
jgi:hypothetical protein